MDTGIPLLQQLIFRDMKKRLHGTSSTLVFLNHFFPLKGRHVAWPKISSVTLTWMSPTLARHLSKERVNSWAVRKLKPWNFSRKTSQPWPSRSSLASSHGRKVWEPLGSILTTGAMGIQKADNKTQWVGRVSRRRPERHFRTKTHQYPSSYEHRLFNIKWRRFMKWMLGVHEKTEI